LNFKSIMKKGGIFLTVLLLVCAFCLPVFATDNVLHSIDITIQINEDGSANITEIWDMTNSEGTEVYKEVRNMENSPIHSLRVSENGNEFKSMGEDWDIDASREEKTNRSGMVVENGDYELCFGIGEYGDHVYTMNYTVDRFVHQYEDMYGMNYQLVGEDMEPKPEKIYVRVYSSQISENTLVYGFGYEGTIYVLENPDQVGERYIEVTNQDEEATLGRVNYVNILAGFPESTFSDADTAHSDRTFEDVAEEAKEGSNYGDDEALFPFLMIGAGLFIAAVVGIAIASRGYGKPHFTDGNDELPKYRDVDYFRDIPADKDIFMFFYIVKQMRLTNQNEYQSGLLSGILLDWIRKNKVEFISESKQGILKEKEIVSFRFMQNPVFENKIEETLYQYFQEAAGANQILEKREFEKWCKKRYSKMEKWFHMVEGAVEEMMTRNGYREVAKVKNRKKLLFTPKYREQILAVMGFKKFIEEFSSLGEKQVKEVMLWEDYLIFASILGMADRVEKEIGRLYPDFEQESYIHPYYMMSATRAFAYGGVHSMHSAASAARNSGGGGSSSLSGGGGSFSGGGGGGTR